MERSGKQSNSSLFKTITMNMIKKYKLNYFVIYILLFFTSCKPLYQIYDSSFKPNSEIVIPFYVFRSCAPAENPFNPNSFGLRNKCDESLFDSIRVIFDNSFWKSSLNIKDIKNSNKILFLNDNHSKHRNREWLYKSHKRLVDTAFIKAQLDRESLFNLIPIITYYDDFGRNANGYTYNITIYLNILIFENSDLIYSTKRTQRLVHPFIIEENELDKSQLDVVRMIDEIVNRAIQPFIDRLK